MVAWAKSRYPDRLVAGVSLSQRQANMAYVRDRMIEAGICGGMDLAWNLKRGGPERSIDYLAYRKAGRWIGVDIGSAYDDTSIRLEPAVDGEPRRHVGHAGDLLARPELQVEPGGSEGARRPVPVRLSCVQVCGIAMPRAFL